MTNHLGRSARTLDLWVAETKVGVGRVVHFSVANASPESRLPYFGGKGVVKEILKGMGILRIITRPTLVFNEGDLLLNDMAWAFRHFPVFPVFGKGDYPVQPVYADDLATRPWIAGFRTGSLVADVARPETFSFEA